MSWSNAFKGVTDLVSEFIEDPDKQAQIKLELERVQSEVRKQLLGTTTTPRIDAFVKLLIAFRDIILPLLRPLGSAAMTGAAIYCATNGIELTGATEAVMVAAFPGWMASRHVHKHKDKRKRSTDVTDEDFGDY